jgi:hypothetical protein
MNPCAQKLEWLEIVWLLIQQRGEHFLTPGRIDDTIGNITFNVDTPTRYNPPMSLATGPWRC